MQLQALFDGVAAELGVPTWPLNRLPAVHDHVRANPMYARFVYGLARLGATEAAEWTPPTSLGAIVHQFLDELETRYIRLQAGSR